MENINLTNDDLLELIKEYGIQFLDEIENYEDRPIEMSEINCYFEDVEQVLRAAFYGGDYKDDNFNPNMNYFYFNGYGNIVSLHEFDLPEYLNEVIDKDDFIEFLIDNNLIDEEDYL